MKTNKILFIGLALISLNLLACKPKDSDIKAAVEQKINGMADIANPVIEVKDGVATISGVCKDEATKQTFETSVSTVKGVVSVVDNCTLIPPPPIAQTSPVLTASDSLLVKGVMDATKDFPGVKSTVKEGVITLTGEIKKSSLPKLMMTLNSLKPKKVENQLEVK